MTLLTLARWLQCPHCSSPLNAEGQLALRCINNHSFDANKRGYVNLLASSNRMIGDSPAMLDAREHFLTAGHFAPVRAALVDAVRSDRSLSHVDSSSEGARIVDAGCGTGYYLEGVLESTSTAIHALAMDISPHAVARAVRSGRAVERTNGSTADGLVADIWQPLPLRESIADVVFAVFAPRNLTEFHRILRPAGHLVVVVPTVRHIAQLRQSGHALDIPADKAERLEQDASQLFSLSSRTPLEYDVELTGVEAAQLLGMGPSSHHTPAQGSTEGALETSRRTVTVSVDVLTFAAR